MEIIKNIRKNTYIILIITAIVLVLTLKEDFYSTISALNSMNFWFLLIAFIIFTISLILKAYAYYLTVNEKNKFSFMESISHTIIIQFFNGITPFSTGGQPGEVYLLSEHKINASKGTSFSIQNFIFYQTSLVVLGLFAVCYNYFFHMFPHVPVLRRLVFLGFIINTLVAVFLFIIAFSKKANIFIVNKLISFLAKIKIVKNKDITKSRWEGRLYEFNKGAAYLKKKRGLFFIGVTLHLLSLICFYSVPLFIVYALGDFSSVNLIQSIVASAYVLIIGSFVPIPGASGGIEYGFLTFFHTFLSSGVTGALLLVWRFITYYLPMIIGAVLFNMHKGSEEVCE